MAHFLSLVFEARDDTSLDPGVVVGFNVEIVVSVCFLSEHRSEDSGALPLHLNIEEGNPVARLLFHSELNGRVLAVEVVMELTEAVVLAGPDYKRIVYVPQP